MMHSPQPLRVLFVPNWTVQTEWTRWASSRSNAEAHWFFRHFEEPVETRVVGIDSWKGWRFEERLLHHYPIQSLRAVRAAREADAVICHGAQSAVALLALARLADLPPVIVVDVGALNAGRRRETLRFNLTRWAMKAAAAIVWHSKGSQDYVSREAPELASRGHFLPYGVDQEKFSAYAGLDKADYVVCVGSASRDWQSVISAWDDIDDIPLLLVGAKGCVSTANPRIEVLPVVGLEDYCVLAARARFSILPLEDSPISVGQMTLLQSLAMGTPVIASDVAPIRDYLGMGTVSVDPADCGALSASVTRLWADRDEQERLRRAGLEVTADRLSQRRMATALERLLREVVKPDNERRGGIQP